MGTISSPILISNPASNTGPSCGLFVSSISSAGVQGRSRIALRWLPHPTTRKNIKQNKGKDLDDMLASFFNRPQLLLVDAPISLLATVSGQSASHLLV